MEIKYTLERTAIIMAEAKNTVFVFAKVESQLSRQPQRQCAAASPPRPHISERIRNEMEHNKQFSHHIDGVPIVCCRLRLRQYCEFTTISTFLLLFSVHSMRMRWAGLYGAGCGAMHVK